MRVERLKHSDRFTVRDSDGNGYDVSETTQAITLEQGAWKREIQFGLKHYQLSQRESSVRRRRDGSFEITMPGKAKRIIARRR